MNDKRCSQTYELKSQVELQSHKMRPMNTQRHLLNVTEKEGEILVTTTDG